ncbi:T9SS type A sorting domain-containing protein [Olivibacter domesticus]|uniref:Por secretion system C-terminal sorting domain-containing protein n=1 Tax=Olivibacter domesticus TaxID=407022 RepID=A0A1H7PW65_OLID1|nr:T9SS type A sorting domain-containing protein [Olivibacter domesticus]SEL40080.1 Por secretion system C-terminal sorting domain-containing protein [Olivibacter domesticus]
MVYKYSSYIYSSIVGIGLLLCSMSDVQATYTSKMDSTTNKQQQSPPKKSRITDNGFNKFDNLHFGFKPFSPVAGSQKIAGSENEKLLSNVKVFPNQISDQINLSFKLNKDSNVSIKVMDALGNEVTTLLAQRLSAGEQTNSFTIGNKLNQGFYFIRVVAGTETIVKRIEVL